VKSILANNLITKYEDEGEGHVILILHGWRRSMSDFDEITKILKNNYRIIRVDLPGFGETQMPSKTWKLDDYVDFIKSFIEKLEIKPYTLVGHSFGGRIIIKGTAEKKLEAEKIILISAAGVKMDAFRKKIFQLLAKIGDIVSYIPPLIFVRKKLKHKFYKIIDSDYLESGNMKEVFKAVIEEDLTSFAKEIKKDTLLIWGDKDIQTPLKDGKFLNSLIADSRLEIIPNCGHFVHQEEPQKVADIISNFVR
jgi:pimeloyl-ACP methyl ester carboxylesterase